MTGAIVYRWGVSIPGREAASMQVFADAVARFEELAKEGRIHGHQEFINLTGRPGGFMIAQGDVAELQRILAEPDTLRLNVRAEAIVADFEVQLFGGGTDQSVQELMGLYMATMADGGYL